MDRKAIDSERVIMRWWIEAAQAIGIILPAAAYAAAIGLNEPESDS